MNFRFGLRQVQAQVQLCKLCDQIIDTKNQRETQITAEIFGTNAYAICPCCRQQVSSKTQHSVAWHEKVKLFIKREESNE